MPDLVPAEAVEAAARALCELDGGNPDSRATEWADGHWTTRASDPAWTYYTVEAHAALTAAAPHIAAKAVADLRAGIEALRDEWLARAASLRAVDSYAATLCDEHAGALDALLRGAK